MIALHLMMIVLNVLQNTSPLIPENKFCEKKINKKVEKDLIF